MVRGPLPAIKRHWPGTAMPNHNSTAQCAEPCLGLVEPGTPGRREWVPKAERWPHCREANRSLPSKLRPLAQASKQADERPRAKTRPRPTTSGLRHAFCSIIGTVRRNLPDEPPGVSEHGAEFPDQTSARLDHQPLGCQQPGPAHSERALLTAGQFARHLGAPLRNARKRFHESGDPLPVSNAGWFRLRTIPQGQVIGRIEQQRPIAACRRLDQLQIPVHRLTEVVPTPDGTRRAVLIQRGNPKTSRGCQRLVRAEPATLGQYRLGDCIAITY